MSTPGYAPYEPIDSSASAQHYGECDPELAPLRDGRPPIEGITSRDNGAEETFGDDGSFAWQSDEGHSVELYADGSFRVVEADGSVYEREPFEPLQGQNATHPVPGDRSDFRVDSDGTFHWTDGRGTFVEVGRNGDASFARDDGSVRHHLQGRREGDAAVLDSRPVGYSEGGRVSFPLPGGGGAVLSGGFETSLPDGTSVRSMDDGDYHWTDNNGNFLSYKDGTLTMQSANGDWRRIGLDRSDTQGNVYGEEPSTNWPDYGDVIGREGGIRTITNPDGSVASTNDQGDFDLQGHGGGSLYRDSESGEIARISKDGVWMLSNDDGEHIVGHLAFDGPPPIGQDALADGALSPGSGEVTELPDGSTLTTAGDGSEYLRHPDGSTEFSRDGNVVRTGADGTITWEGPDVESGKASVDEVVAGSLLRTDGLPDGVDRGVAEEFNLTGELVSGSGGGDESYRRYEGGGSITIDRDSGDITLDDGNGRVRHYDASGEIIGTGGSRAGEDDVESTGNVLGEPPRDTVGTRDEANGAYEFRGEDGFFQWQSDTGHIVQLDGHGGFYIESTSGERYHCAAGGELKADDTRHSERSWDNSAFEELPDGGVRWSDGEGATFEIYADGSSRFTRADGSVRTRDADGTVSDPDAA